MELTLIIPVYKVEKYLAKCLDSCLNQDISESEYEIIAVNDGSPDGCGNILDEYDKKYNNISVIHQENLGLSAARNIGLQNAKGNYVWFIDSDDWIEPQSIPIIVETIKSTRKTGRLLDLIQIGYRNVEEDNGSIEEVNLPSWAGTISGETYMQYPHLPTPVQFNIYRRSLLIKENLLFYPGIYHEDIEFKPRVLHFCKTCICIDNTVYNYLKRTCGNITSSFKLKNGLDLITTNKSLMKFMNEHSLSIIEKRFFINRMGITLNLILKGYKSLTSSEREILMRKVLENRNNFKILIHSQKIKYKIEGYSIFLFPTISLRILRFIL